MNFHLILDVAKNVLILSFLQINDFFSDITFWVVEFLRP